MRRSNNIFLVYIFLLIVMVVVSRGAGLKSSSVDFDDNFFCVSDYKLCRIFRKSVNKSYVAVENNVYNKLCPYQLLKSDEVEKVDDSGVIYLTFDDGPSNSGSTEKILDILKKENVKATFFVSKNGDDYVLRREYEEGHEVALHTYFHKYSYIYSSVDSYFADLKMIQQRVQKITGKEVKVLRFPGGSNNTVSNKYQMGIMKKLKEEVSKRGFIYFDWNVDSGDAWSCAKSKVIDKKSCVYNNVVNSLKKDNVNVVLLHDVKDYTADALEDIIHYAKRSGYRFDVITLSTPLVQFG